MSSIVPGATPPGSFMYFTASFAPSTYAMCQSPALSMKSVAPMPVSPVS